MGLAEHPDRRSAHTLAQLQLAMELQRQVPILSLRQVLHKLRLLDEATLAVLEWEDPELLRSRSRVLVERLLITDEEWHRAMAIVAGLVEIDVLTFSIDPRALDLLPLQKAMLHRVVPLGMLHDLFMVASSKPTSVDLLHELVSASGHSVAMVWASADDIDRRLALLSKASGVTLPPVVEPTPPASKTAPPPPPTMVQDELVQLAMQEVGATPDAAEMAAISESSGVVRLVKRTIAEALRTNTSDIHIESNPGDEPTFIRFRRDGDLEQHLVLPAKLRAPLVSRIKIMAKLDISERRRPQDGKIDFSEFGGPKLELRVAVVPTHDGLEDVVLRLLASSKPLPLSSLGFQLRDQEIVASFSARSFGLILAAGPTGSGKTTTLHSMLAEVNTPERKIWTAEDPIEISQPGLRQVQVNSKIGVTFASAMRSFLRADPDIIMIGEIRDAETAKIAIEASLTGHLVLSTLHTNSASESVVRLLDLGMDPMNFADSLLGIVAQRLVRRLCRQCAAASELDDRGWQDLVNEYRQGSPLTEQQAAERLLDAAGVSSPAAVRVWHPVGCERCGGKGYKGRQGVYELLQNSETIRQLIQERARPAGIFSAAVTEGMRSLRHDALEKVVQGHLDMAQARAAYR